MKSFTVTLMLLSVLVSVLPACRSPSAEKPDTTESLVITLAGYGTHRQAYQSLAQLFQEMHPGVEIQYISLSEQTARVPPEEMASVADVLLLDGRPLLEAAPVFLDLGPLLTADTSFDAANFWPGLMDACQASGVQTGLPLRADPSLLLFDKAAFDMTGLPHPTPGWTWSLFQSAAQTLTEREGEQTIRYGFVDRGRPLFLLAPFVDALLAQYGYEPARLATELAWYVELVDQGAIPAHTGDPIIDARDREALISRGQAAMWVGNLSELQRWHDAFADNLGVAPFPVAAAGGPSNPVRVDCVMISAGTSQSEAAWKWIHFLTWQPPIAMESQQFVSPRPSVGQTNDSWQQVDEITGTAIRYALEHGWYSYESPELGAVGEALNQVLTSGNTLAESLPPFVDSLPAIPLISDNTPIVIATPRLTPTPDESSGATEVITVEFDVSFVYPRDRQTIVAMAQAFNESQNRIEVIIDTGGSPFSGPYGPLDMAGVYDCFAWVGRTSGFASASEKLYNLTPLLDLEDASFKADFDPTQLARNQLDGGLYALPVAIRPFVIQYNVELFAELGVGNPLPEWTANDFWTVASAATRNNSDRRIYGFVPGQLAPENLLLFVPGASPFYDLEKFPPAAVFNEPGTIQALTWLVGMVEAGVMYPVDPPGTQAVLSNLESQQEQARVIEAGQAAMWVQQAGRRDYGFQISEVPFPLTDLTIFSGQVPTTIVLSISRGTGDPTGCWEWFKFLSSQPEAFPGIPVRRSLLESSAWVDVVGHDVAVAYRTMAARPLRPQGPVNQQQYGVTYAYEFWWAEALRHALMNGNPTGILEEMQRRADAYLTCIIALNEESPNPEQSMACVREADPEFQR
jgi:ABC-type glycerol-3-phosphate transport system substrate-binding protein